MSGDAVPYHLRPHKSVDRRVFLDLLSRFERWRPVSQYAYVSMGAYPLEDHRLIHRVMGITRLIAFDLDKHVVERQKFNKPIESCWCLHRKSEEIIEKFDYILEKECNIEASAGVIVWLDYTNPRQLGKQIREFQSLLDKLRVGDVVRVTVNAHPNSFIEPQIEGEAPILAAKKRERQYQNLKSRIGEFLPSETSPDHMTFEELPRAISVAFGAAALKAFPATGSNLFCPLSIVRYADTEQMLSMTGAVMPRNSRDDILRSLNMSEWPFASIDWSAIHRLVVPALTLRERLFLERGIVSESPDNLIRELGFHAASGVNLSEFLESYRNYYRFYPTLLSADV